MDVRKMSSAMVEMAAEKLKTENKLREATDEISKLSEIINDLKLKIQLISGEKADMLNQLDSKGYGEQGNSENGTVFQNITQLRQKIQFEIRNAGDNSYLLQLIENLYTSYDKLCDKGNKEKEDLERQIEHNDALRQIHVLKEPIEELEKKKARDVPKEFEMNILQNHLWKMIPDMVEEKLRTENKLRIATDKISKLCEIINDLELKIQLISGEKADMLNQIDQMREVTPTQTRCQQELVLELEKNKIPTEERKMNDYVVHLEEKLRKYELSTEHFNVDSTAVKQMKSELHDMSTSLDKRIKELEALHMSGSNLSISQPSEDISIENQIDATRCLTPDYPNAPLMLPFDQLLKLKDKMMKHARAEKVAFKRIENLDMQLAALKIQNEKLQAEQEMIQYTVSEQLFQIEAMRGQLEQQKQNASFEQRQATSQLKLQLHDVNAKLHKKEQTLEMKELELKNVRIQLSEVSQLLNEKQEEIIKTVETKMRAEYKDLIDGLTRDKLFYKNQYELCQESENKLRKDLVEVENNLKVKTEDLGKIMQQYTEIRQELKQANKFNEGLSLEEDELDQELSKSQVIEYENRITKIKTVIDKDNQRLSKSMSDAEDKRQSVRKNLEVIINNSETDRINMKRKLTISENELIQATEVIQRLRKSEIKLQTELSQLYEQMNELICKNERYSDEKIVLRNKLLRARGKQKALIFQKHYLFRVIGGYQSINDNMLAVIAQLTDSERTYINERKLNSEKKNPRARFKCIALMIIGVHRIKWMYCKDDAEDCE